MSVQPIENYGVIGNMRFIALVGMNGSIDFLCYPEFDSPTSFAALLDKDQGERFQIAPCLTNARIRQMYLPDTNILLTRFLAEEGVVELADYMPIEEDAAQPNEIIRTVSVVRGNVHFEMRCQSRFKYATSSHRTEISDGCAVFPPVDSTCPPMALYCTLSFTLRSIPLYSPLKYPRPDGSVREPSGKVGLRIRVSSLTMTVPSGNSPVSDRHRRFSAQCRRDDIRESSPFRCSEHWGLREPLQRPTDETYVGLAPPTCLESRTSRWTAPIEQRLPARKREVYS